MSYEDCVFTAAMDAIEHDCPVDLMPLVITNQAALWAGLESGQAAGLWD